MADACAATPDGVSGAGGPAGGKGAKAKASMGYETHQDAPRKAPISEVITQKPPERRRYLNRLPRSELGYAS